LTHGDSESILQRRGPDETQTKPDETLSASSLENDFELEGFREEPEIINELIALLRRDTLWEQDKPSPSVASKKDEFPLIFTRVYSQRRSLLFA
jgi:hypothetical protein